VTFERVSFGYRKDQPALEDLSLALAPGQSVALTGPSGAGKSTLAALLLRLYDPRAGAS
jgi:ABC-type multidrug transport system fused ATPase/permease subunit